MKEDDARWTDVIKDVRLMIARSELELSGGEEEDIPFDNTAQPTGSGLRLNGLGDQAADDFIIPLDAWDDFADEDDGWLWSFCKTNREPYDQIVCAALLSVKHHFGDQVRIGSDGSWENEWTDGAAPEPISGRKLFLEGQLTNSPIDLYRRAFPKRTIEQIVK